MKEFIEKTLNDALAELQNQGKLPKDLSYQVQVERCRDRKYGDFACNIALMLSKSSDRPARELAQQIVDVIPESPKIARIDIAGPGFINFLLAENAIVQVVEEILKLGDDYGRSITGKGKRVHIEFVSANPTGPLHVGHGRSAAYGACVANLLTAVGYQVHREYYVNDSGRQMRILALSVWLRYLQSFDVSIELPNKAYQGDYIVDIARALKQQYDDAYVKSDSDITDLIPKNLSKDDLSKEDIEKRIDAYVDAMIKLIGREPFETFRHAALNSILEDIKGDLAEFGVAYDAWFRESTLFKKGLFKKGVALLEEHSHVYKKEGATWFRATDFGDEKDRVLIRENGQPTYFASDVAYHLYKYDQAYDNIIDIFGADHHGYIARIRAFLQGLGKDPNKLHVLLVQFAILYRGKEKVSMSTRSGNFVTLRELRHEVGNDAARYFYIMRKPEQHLDFDLELAKSQSADNPVYYIQYAHARICSVWKQMKTSHLTWDTEHGCAHLSVLTNGLEKSLMDALAQYPEIIDSTAINYEPHVLANFLQKLANLFHSYYNSFKFLVEEDDLRNARLCLVAAIQQVIKNGLGLLGITVPEEM